MIYMYKLNLYMSVSVFKVSYFMANKEFQTNKHMVRSGLDVHNYARIIICFHHYNMVNTNGYMFSPL